MQGYIYLLHFTRPVGNLSNPRGMARHYLGWALDPDAREAQHRAGHGAALTRAAVAQGIAWTLHILAAGDRDLERALKQKKAAPRLCPICGATHRGGRLSIPGCGSQLALPLPDLDDWPVMPDSHWTAPLDRYERAYLASWGRARMPTSAADLGHIDALI